MTVYAKLFWLVIVLYVVLRGFLYYAQYNGSQSPELRGKAEIHFSAEEIERGFAYSRRGFWVRLLRTALDLVLLLVLVQTGAAAWLSDRLPFSSGNRWFVHAPLFTVILVSGLFLFHLPFSFYFGYVLERRFDFATLSLPGWFLLQTKNLVVLLVLAALASLLWFGLLRFLPRGWVLAVPAAFLSCQAVLTFLVPVVLLPIYYRASSLEAGTLRERVVEVAERAGIQVKDVLVIDASRYSRHTNAFVTGLGASKSIYLYDTLLGDHPEGEACTVVAHEAGHWRAKHVLKGLALAGLGLLVGCLLLQFLYPSLASALGDGWRPLTDPGSLPALYLLLVLAGFFSSPLPAGISRHFEREADRAAVELTGDPEAFVAAEKRLARTNRSQVLPHPLVVFWFASHPPSLERIESAIDR